MLNQIRSARTWTTILPGIVATLALAGLFRNLANERAMKMPTPIFTSGSQPSRTSEQHTQQEVKLKNAAEVPHFISTKNYTIPGCKCVRFGLSVESIKETLKMVEKYPSIFSSTFLQQHNFEGHSTCSDYSTQRGRGQNVISYSFYSPRRKVDLESNHSKKYLLLLADRAYRVKEVYPGWIMRIYHNLADDDMEAYGFLCKILCTHQHVDLCHVRKLPGYGNLVKRKVVGRVWRFAVIGDPTISRFLVRDADSVILDREVVVVNKWLASNKSFHVIRDHPNHNSIMLAGLWGGTNKNAKLMRRIAEKMFLQPLNLKKYFDQHLLAKLVWPHIKNDVMQHDSYHCDIHKNSLPFPVRRKDGYYCGWGPLKIWPRKKVLRTPCPIICRPETNKNWTYC